jgi:hypothetical protein
MRAPTGVPQTVELLFLTRLDRGLFPSLRRWARFPFNPCETLSASARSLPEPFRAVTLVIDGLAKTVSDAVSRQIYFAAGAPA